ncbi:MAG TPA: zinc-binding dehydrogenase [Spirochaetia bacterium]|nr:zinc-binding dehydrogenase [Spirochaetia bacterium]
MKAVQLTEVGKPLELREVEVPRLQPGEVLVRIRAAGICHSDAHYRAGVSPTGPLPLTPGHEIAGVIERASPGVEKLESGDRVCLHYLRTCGVCAYCVSGHEQFCLQGQMIGKHRDGGYAEFIAVPEKNAVPLPDSIPFEHAALMMCSSATSFHALRKTRMKGGETVAVFGAGGLGMSAIQLARALGAEAVYAVDIRSEKLKTAERYGAVPIDASKGDPVEEILGLTDNRGVDVALELTGLPITQKQSCRSLAVFGRAGMVGITGKPFEVDSYTELIGREAEIIGVSDHLLTELWELIVLVERGKLDFEKISARSVALEAGAINRVLDRLEEFAGEVRTVILP